MKPGQRNARILIVDDDTMTLKITELSLAERGYQVTAFENPVECIAQAEQGKLGTFHCLITDYSMPGMNGVTLMHRMKAIDPTLSMILTTAENERAIIRDTLREGAVDFLDKPVDVDRFFQSVEDAVAKTVLRRKRAATESSLRAANSTGLLKNIDCPEWVDRLSVVYAPKHQLGGDFVDVFKTADESKVCLFGDISGHDIQSALFSSHFLGTIQGRRTCQSPFDIQSAFHHTNSMLCARRERSCSAGNLGGTTSLCVCSIREAPDTGNLHFLNAGIPALYLIDTQRKIEILPPGYSPLGWFSDLSFEETARPRDACARVIGFTDGILELAMRRQIDVLALVSTLIQTREAHTHPILSAQEDDVLIIDLSPHPETPSPAIPIVHGVYPGDQARNIDTFEQVWKNSLSFVLGREQKTVIQRFTLACREGMLNAINHGCGRQRKHQASISIWLDEANNEIEAIIVDPGSGHSFDYAARDSDLLDPKPGNLGLVMMSKLVDEMQLEQSGAQLVLRSKLE
ncbi:MAG: response regulator [Opitutales bacterium]|nr:response regulator [Opitutales bacterium]